MKRLVPLFVFSIAFAFVEAAVVVYLRKIFGFSGEYQTENYSVIFNLGFIAFLKPTMPFLPDRTITYIEVIREISTLVMLGSLGYLVGKTTRSKIGSFLIAFSLWDIFYYIFLKILIDWPKTPFDIDVFFLNPVPWVGPVITPIFISSVLLIAGLKLVRD